MNKGFEIIYKEETLYTSTTTRRSKVPGGWLVVSEIVKRGGEGGAGAVSQIFIEDKNHDWKV